MTESIIIIAIVIAVVGLAAGYVYRAKRNGKKCIGCPDSGCGGCGRCGEKNKAK